MHRAASGLSLLLVLAIGTAFASLHAPAAADGTDKKPLGPPHGAAAEKRNDCVEFARTWAAAVAEAQAMRAPLMVHCLDYDASATWGYHLNVLCGKSYVECAAQNSVDVVGMVGMDKAHSLKDKRAQTYEAEVNGEKVEFLVAFPGLTVADLVAMAGKIAPYDTTGYAPFTALVDPWTEATVQFWSGRQSAHSLIEAVLAARKTLEKDHGKGGGRADVRSLFAAREASAAKTAANEFALALDILGALAVPAERWPDSLKALYAEARAAVVAAAEKALAAIEQRKGRDPAGAKRDLSELIGRLRGTGLEERAKALLRAFG